MMPRTDGDGAEEMSTLPENGVFYLVEERTPDYSYAMFAKALTEKRPGLVITRDYPQDVFDRYSLPECQIHWLTHIVGENHINPTSLGLLLSRISGFIDRKGKGATIILDGVEYLISQNSYDRILHFVHQIRDIVIVGDGSMILPIDTRVVARKELAFLERNLEIIEPLAKVRGRRLLFELDEGTLKVLRESDR